MHSPSPDDLVRVVQGLAASGRAAEAEVMLRQVRAVEPEVRFAIGRAWLALYRPEEARTAFRSVLPHAKAETELGFLAQSEGDFGAASAHFMASIQLQPVQGSAYQGWTQCNRATSADEALVEQMERAAGGEMGPQERMALHYALGKAYADLGEDERAVKAYDVANQLARQIQRPAPFDRASYAAAVDEIIDTFQPELMKKVAQWGTPRKLPLIVTGMMRSGTTLVEQILTNHPQVGTAGEVEFFVERGPEVMKPFKQRAIQNLADEYVRLLRTVARTADQPEVDRVVDKSPMNVPLLGLIHAAYPKAKIVALRRDGLDTCWSIYANAYSQSPAFAHDQGDIAFAWHQNERLLDHWKRVLPENAYLEVAYETLVTDPEPTIRTIARHCGLSWADAMLHPETNSGRITTSSVYQARQPINPASIRRSHRYLPWLREFRELVS